MKVANACVRALLRRKRCVRRRLAKGVLFVATRVCPRCVAIAGHVIKLKLTRRGNALASMEGGLFQFTDDVVALAVSRCAGALLSRTLYVLVLKSLPKLLSFLR